MQRHSSTPGRRPRRHRTGGVPLTPTYSAHSNVSQPSGGPRQQSGSRSSLPSPEQTASPERNKWLRLSNDTVWGQSVTQQQITETSLICHWRKKLQSKTHIVPEKQHHPTRHSNLAGEWGPFPRIQYYKGEGQSSLSLSIDEGAVL